MLWSGGARAVCGGLRGHLLLCCPLLPDSVHIFSKMLDETAKEEILLCPLRRHGSLQKRWREEGLSEG